MPRLRPTLKLRHDKSADKYDPPSLLRASAYAPVRVVDAPMRVVDAPVRVFGAPMRNHQHFNAEAFASKGAADEGIQSQLTAKQLYIYLMGRYDRPERLAEMAEKMRALATPDAASRVASLVESVAK